MTKKRGYIKHSYKRNKKNYAVNKSSILLAIIRVITGGEALNPIVLAALTTAGIFLKSYYEFKNIKDKTDLLKFGATSYRKVLTN